MKRIRVLVVDDSSFLRRTLPRLLESDADIEVVGTAADGAAGLQLVKELRPDVVTLDVEMPVMDGLTALRHIMKEAPTPVLMVSSLTSEGARETLEALALGAVDFVTKPAEATLADLAHKRTELVEKIKSVFNTKIRVAAQADVARDKFHALIEALSVGRQPLTPTSLSGKSSAAGSATGSAKHLIAIAASTGGPAALQFVLQQLPADLPAGIVIVQHISAGFTHLLAERLTATSHLQVREAEEGMLVAPGMALLSPANVHLTIARHNGALMAHLTPEPADALHRPSADVLFNSIAACCAAETCGVILTGMGQDGAVGLRAIREGGGYVIAQDEATSLIYGMPRRAVELGGVNISLALSEIAAEIIRTTSPNKA